MQHSTNPVAPPAGPTGGTSGNKSGWRIWIDRGGTFTDLVAWSPASELVTHKLLSENPGLYEDAAVEGIRRLLKLRTGEPIPPGAIEDVKMGTTVATNALLERKGEPTVFVTTKGFGDLPRIGYQNRPRLFDLEVVVPNPLFSYSIEIPERVGADGELVTPLDEAVLHAELAKARLRGYNAVAIAFLHGHRFPAHEQRAGVIAKAAGFTQISTSHECSPLVRLVSRGDTATVDAYLSPILRRYVNQVANAIGADQPGGPRLLFMQSSGGLTAAQRFRGKDAILSGPAGGVVGMVKVGVDAGFHKVIGFDMGGTSTDVTHFNGQYERSYECNVAGVRLRAPMMHIHTVAAGGGSVLEFDGTRFRVGPHSSGAYPGPSCYGHGGPLSVTDCNAVLGKIQPDYFPKVFGVSGSAPIDSELARENFEILADRIAKETGRDPWMPEEIAEGFLRIAVTSMANAIKKISIAQGHDITEYVLNAFGGAAAQHACLVADALGISRILVHPMAGVLSAYGMGLAEIRTLRSRQMGVPIAFEALQSAMQEAADEAIDETASQGVYRNCIRIEETVFLRYEGSDTTLPVAMGTAADMLRNFNELHHHRFGFSVPNRPVIIDSLTAEAIGERIAHEDPLRNAHITEPGLPESHASVFCKSDWYRVPIYRREKLMPGQTLHEPSIVVEDTATIFLEPEWSAVVTETGRLEMFRQIERKKETNIDTEVDPVMLEVFNNLFMSVAEQMGATLQNTAYSVNMKERLDFSCALFDPDGNLVANAPHVPVHLGSMSESVRSILRKRKDTMRPGQAYVMNAPYDGGTHLPDVTVITPVFDEAGENLVFVVASRGHHADIGGTTPGSAPPDSKTIHEEGVLIEDCLLVDNGRFHEEEILQVLTSGDYPCRNPAHNIADLTAQVAANETGVRETQKMIQHFGFPAVHAYMHHVQDNAEECVRRVISVLKNGFFSYPLDHQAEIKVQITVDKKAREALIDFTGTSKQHSGNFNAPLAVTRAAALYVFRALVDDDIPLNEGCMRPLRIKVPKGTMLNPRYPAAVISGNTEVSQCVADALFAALGVLASSQGTMNNFVYGDEHYQNYETICGGVGAGRHHDGCDAVHSHMTNTRMTDPEILEERFPIRLEEFSIRRGSGGDGAHRGGDGIIHRVKFLAPMTMTTLSLHRHTDPYGLEGGLPGARGLNQVERADGTIETLRGTDKTMVQKGDVFCMHTPGGGGFGKPAARRPHKNRFIAWPAGRPAPE